MRISVLEFDSCFTKYKNLKANFGILLEKDWSKVDEISNAVIFINRDSISLNIMYAPLLETGFSSMEAFALEDINNLNGDLHNWDGEITDVDIVTFNKERINGFSRILVKSWMKYRGIKQFGMTSYTQIDENIVLCTIVVKPEDVKYFNYDLPLIRPLIDSNDSKRKK